MKTFKDLRESKDKTVFKKKMSGYPVVITKTAKGFHLSIDGDVRASTYEVRQSTFAQMYFLGYRPVLVR